MYAFLLFLGAATIAAGIALTASQMSLPFDPTAITPGAVAIIGGLVLIGLGLAVRVLQRIERALADRPLARGSRQAEAVVATASVGDPTRIPFPPKPKVEAVAAPAASPAPTADPALEQFRERFPTLVRFDNAAAEEADVVTLPRTPARAEEELGEVAAGHSAATARTNGAAAAVKGVSRPDSVARPAAKAAERNNVSVFESLWPKGARSGQAAAVPMPVAAEPEARPEPRLDVSRVQQPTPVSVLKSGVVDGMAYTLYSDGSIEAQLPQGTLRFGSITELRNHIEQSS